MKKITDKQILNIIKKLDSDDEEISVEVIKSLLLMILDTRKILRELKKSMTSKVYKRPTNNKNDIIIG